MAHENAENISIRPMATPDASAVAALARQLGYERTADEVAAWIRAAGPTQAAFVAVAGDRVVGWIDVGITWYLQSDRSAKINGLVVSQAVRGAGIGKLLCERAEAWAVEQGVGRIWVTSNALREDAHRFYLRDGYTQAKTSAVFEKRLR